MCAIGQPKSAPFFAPQNCVGLRCGVSVCPRSPANGLRSGLQPFAATRKLAANNFALVHAILRPFQGYDRGADVFRGVSLRSIPGYVPPSLRDAGRARVDERVRVDDEQASSVLPLSAGEGRGEGEHAPIIPVFARPRRSSFPPSPHSSPAGRGGWTRPIGKRMKRRSHPARPIDNRGLRTAERRRRSGK